MKHTHSFQVGSGGVVKGRFVKLSSGKVVLCSADTDAILGVAEDTRDENQYVSVILSGFADVEASAALTVGGPVATDTAGRGKDAETADTVAGNVIEAGVAASGGNYSYVKVLLAVRKIALP